MVSGDGNAGQFLVVAEPRSCVSAGEDAKVHLQPRQRWRKVAKYGNGRGFATAAVGMAAVQDAQKQNASA